jgi:hypothetical protein
VCFINNALAQKKTLPVDIFRGTLNLPVQKETGGNYRKVE